MQADWQEVWHSPQPPDFKLLFRSRVRIVLILSMRISTFQSLAWNPVEVFSKQRIPYAKSAGKKSISKPRQRGRMRGGDAERIYYKGHRRSAWSGWDRNEAAPGGIYGVHERETGSMICFLPSSVSLRKISVQQNKCRSRSRTTRAARAGIQNLSHRKL